MLTFPAKFSPADHLKACESSGSRKRTLLLEQNYNIPEVQSQICSQNLFLNKHSDSKDGGLLNLRSLNVG